MNPYNLYTVGNTVRLILKGVMALQQLRNVFHVAFENTDFPSLDPIEQIAILDALLNRFLSDMWPTAIQAFTTASVTYDSIEAIAPQAGAVWSPGIRVEELIGGTGSAGGESLPTYDALSFVLRPISPSLIRNGYKRFAGLSEANQDDGLLVPSGGMLTGVVNFSALIEADHALGVSGYASRDFHYAIPKTVRATPFVPYDVVGSHLIVDSNANGNVKTQATRKRGRGI